MQGWAHGGTIQLHSLHPRAFGAGQSAEMVKKARRVWVKIPRLNAFPSRVGAGMVTFVLRFYFAGRIFPLFVRAIWL